MPDILSHLICSDEATKKLSIDVRSIINHHKKIFNLGAQGPDLFFYYKVYPWQNAGDIERFANTIHSSKTTEFFMNAANTIKQNINHDPMGFFKAAHYDTDLHRQFAYMAGFLTHYALDTSGHPYIFYHSGIDSGHNHKYLECIIDTLIMDIYDAKKIKLHKTGQAINLSTLDRLVVSDFLSKVIYDTYNEKVDPDVVNRAIKDMSVVMKTMYDPRALKRGAFSVIDRVSKSKGKIVTATYPAKLDSKIDYLNLQHNTWCHPLDETLTYNKSFLECFKEAIDYSNMLISGFTFYIIGQMDHNSYERVLGDKLYDTGLHFSKGKDMSFAQPIIDYKKVFKIK